LPEGLTQLSLSGTYLRMPRLLDGDEALDDSSVVESAVASLVARHHIAEGWAVDAVLPAGWAALHPASGPRTGVSGLGDVELGARYELGALWGVGGYNPSVAVRLGVALPTGARVTSGSAAAMPNALRLGTGAFNVLAEVRYTQFLERHVALAVGGDVRQALSSDGDGRTPGFRAGAGLDVIVLPIDWLVLRASLQYQYMGRLDGGAGGISPNSGGNWLRAEAMALFRLGDHVSVGATARGPLYVNVNGRQLVEQWGLGALVAVSLGGADDEEDEHDHDHGGGHGHDESGHDEHAHDESGHDDHGHDEHGHDEHGHDEHAHDDHAHDEHGDDEHAHDDHAHDDDDHDDRGADSDEATPRAGDVVDAATGGASFALADALARGRITVVDFWADWCPPCHEIDAILRSLAARYEGLAVRRVEVPSADCEAAREHLGDDTRLPQVWLFDEHGELIERLVGPGPGYVRSRLEDMLAPRAAAAE